MHGLHGCFSVGKENSCWCKYKHEVNFPVEIYFHCCYYNSLMAIASPVLRVLMKQISDNVKFEYIWYKVPYVFFIVYFKGEMLNAIEPKILK